MATAAPCRASASAIARPIPPPPPGTTATVPDKRSRSALDAHERVSLHTDDLRRRGVWTNNQDNLNCNSRSPQGLPAPLRQLSAHLDRDHAVDSERRTRSWTYMRES